MCDAFALLGHKENILRLLLFVLQCRVHGETYSMFCTSKKSLMCVKCFRELPLDSRMHCVDLETAYNHGAKKLDKALTVSAATILTTHPHCIF